MQAGVLDVGQTAVPSVCLEGFQHNRHRHSCADDRLVDRWADLQWQDWK